MNIVFDIDDTMYDLMEPFQIAHEMYFSERTPADGAELFERSRICSDIVLKQENQGIIRHEEAFYRRIQMTYQGTGIKISREDSERFEKEYRRLQSRIHMFAFMEEVLNYCKKERIPLAVLTNGNGGGQRRKAEVLKLNRWIEDGRIFVTGELGHHKPDIQAFKAVEERTGFCPEDTWYVGDSYESDIIGASQAGWHTIWLNHRKRPCPTPVNLAEDEIDAGEKLLVLLKQKQMTAAHEKYMKKMKKVVDKIC